MVTFTRVLLWCCNCSQVILKVVTGTVTVCNGQQHSNCAAAGAAAVINRLFIPQVDVASLREALSAAAHQESALAGKLQDALSHSDLRCAELEEQLRSAVRQHDHLHAVNTGLNEAHGVMRGELEATKQVGGEVHCLAPLGRRRVV